MSFVLSIDLIISEFNMSIPNSTIGDLPSMPNPCNKGSLHFKGKDIDVFLAKFEDYADRAHLTKFQRCDFIRLYFSKKERKVLDILEGFLCRNWDKLKEELWSLYSSSCASGSISLHAERYTLKYDQEVRYESAGHEANGSQTSGSESYVASELGSSVGQCDMCRESPHDISNCRETKFLMFLGICDLDRDGRVVMRDGSALPRAEGKGRAARVIREREAARTIMPVPTSDSSDICSVIEGTTLDLKSVAPSMIEFSVCPSVVEMEPEVSISESSIYMDSFDMGIPQTMGTWTISMSSSPKTS